MKIASTIVSMSVMGMLSVALSSGARADGQYGIWALDGYNQAQCYVEGADGPPVSPDFCAQYPSPDNTLWGIWALDGYNQAHCYAEDVGAGPVSPALCAQRPSPNNYLYGVWAMTGKCIATPKVRAQARPILSFASNGRGIEA